MITSKIFKIILTGTTFCFLHRRVICNVCPNLMTFNLNQNIYKVLETISVNRLILGWQGPSLVFGGVWYAVFLFCELFRIDYLKLRIYLVYPRDPYTRISLYVSYHHIFTCESRSKNCRSCCCCCCCCCSSCSCCGDRLPKVTFRSILEAYMIKQKT